MSDDTGVERAVETLVAEIERETGWLAELKRDIASTESRRLRLMGAVEQALAALPLAVRTRWIARVCKLELSGRRHGRPPSDRQRMVIELLAERATGFVTSAEIRAELERRGYKASAQFCSNLLKTLRDRRIVFKTGHGRFTINPNSEVLQVCRMQGAQT